MLSRVAVVVVLVVAAVGCGDDAPEEPIEAELGGLLVRVESAPARIQISAPDGEVLIDGKAGGPGGELWPPPMIAAAARTTNAQYEFQAGAFKIEETGEQPWQGVTRFVDLRLEGDAVRFEMVGDDGAALGSGSIAAADDGHVAVTITGPAELNRASFAFDCAADEHFLGFGGQSFDVDHRGQSVPLWVSEDGITKAPVDTYDFGIWFLMGRRHSTHTPMPIYVSSRGYAMLLDTTVRSVFDMCSIDETAVRIEAWESELRMHVFYGPTPAEAVERMTGHVGRPTLPPAFAFAPWLDAIFGEANVQRVADDLRAAGVGVSVIWSEDWRGGNDEGLGYVLEEDWEVDRDIYPNFENLADSLHAAGYKFLVYANTFLDSTVPVYDEAVASGYTIEDENGDPYLFTGVKFEPTTLLDLSNPDAVAWAKGKYGAALDLGADGYMADFSEWLPVDSVLASGEDAERVHNLYPVEWARLNRELFDAYFAADGIERLFFVRAAYLGSQPLVSVVWAGDQQTDFTEGDGIKSIIPMGVGLGVTGFPYYGHDIAGYMSQLTERVDKELWFRWVTLGALSPVMRTHHGRDARENWNWESDAESTAHLVRWSQFHIRLFPYLYAMAQRAAETGAPMFRPLAFDYPEFEPGWTRTDQYMLGDRLVVAPILDRGATSREVELPAGRWYRLDGGPLDGGTRQVDVAIDDIFVAVPAGTLLALLPEGVDTLVDATQAGVVTLADVGDDRELWVWPGGASSLDEVSGGLSYSWDGTDLSGPVTSATFDGAPITVADPLVVTGPGTLVLNDGAATLEITGGAPDRTLTIRLF